MSFEKQTIGTINSIIFSYPLNSESFKNFTCLVADLRQSIQAYYKRNSSLYMDLTWRWLTYQCNVVVHFFADLAGGFHKYIYITKGDMLQNTCCAYKLLTCASAEILGYI